MADGAAAGFWSYVRQDDEDDGGRVLALAKGLKREYALLTGAGLELFVDRDAIEWGQEWQKRIEDALAGTTFFIPVVTPRYFQSQACRRELWKFVREARQLGLEELLLPVYYIRVPELETEGDPEDELMALVARTQWEDLHEVRLVSEGSADYRVAVNRLATRLVDIAERVASKPDVTPATAGREAPSSTAAEDEDEAPGVVELLAAGEEAMPRLAEAIRGLVEEIQTLGGMIEEGAREMEAADKRGRGFVGRLVTTERLASRLEQPAERIAEIGHTYAANLVTVDPAIHTVLDIARADPTQYAEAKEFFRWVKGLSDESREAIKALEEMVRAMDETAELSRALRRPLRRTKAGLQAVLDGQAVTQEWRRRADDIEGGSPDDSPANDG
jgi:uncharacterized protein YukE